MIKYPVLIYDDLCSSCTTYAKYVNKIVNGKITMLGHYSKDGKEFKNEIFPVGYDGLEMSWFVTPIAAYGGRKGLMKLLQYIFSLKEGEFDENIFDLQECTTDCRTAKGVMIRSCSILTQGKIIKVKQ